MKKTSLLCAFSLLFTTSACEMMGFKNNEVKTASLTHRLMMVDKDGVRYGRVELDPLGGGRMYDSEDKLMGNITSVNEAKTASTQPAALEQPIEAQRF